MKVLILAAGYGTRLASVAKDTPKPLLAIHNKPMIDYILEKVVDCPETSEVVVVTNNKFCKNFQEWAQMKKGLRVPIRIVNDGTNIPEERLGSVGDINFVWKNEKIVDDWLVVGGDNVFDFGIGEFIRFAQQKIPAMTIGLYDIGDIKAASKFGVVVVNAQKRVVELQEKPQKPASSFIAMCFYYFPKATLGFMDDYIKEATSTDAAGGYIQWLAAKKNVYGFQFQGKWYDIGSLESLEEAQKYFSR